MLVEELMAINDSRDIIKTAREDGFEEGIEQGRKEIISNMLKLGLSYEEIAKLTNANLSDIEKISKQHHIKAPILSQNRGFFCLKRRFQNLLVCNY
ncbi:MAG: hypothetical protein LBN08_00010 [Lactobacillales bacterium]|jgi:predicted transposase YdaD|nr:hypothetical protein [Lactobacillales bacterium]